MIDAKQIESLLKNSIEVLNIENIKIVGKNKKDTRNKYTGETITSSAYKKFKQDIYICTKKINLEPPYFVLVEIEEAHDADAPISAILDGMEGKAYKNDRDAKLVIISKNKIKKNQPGSIKAYISSMNEPVSNKILCTNGCPTLKDCSCCYDCNHHDCDRVCGQFYKNHGYENCKFLDARL